MLGAVPAPANCCRACLCGRSCSWLLLLSPFSRLPSLFLLLPSPSSQEPSKPSTSGVEPEEVGVHGPCRKYELSLNMLARITPDCVQIRSAERAGTESMSEDESTRGVDEMSDASFATTASLLTEGPWSPSRGWVLLSMQHTWTALRHDGPNHLEMASKSSMRQQHRRKGGLSCSETVPFLPQGGGFAARASKAARRRRRRRLPADGGRADGGRAAGCR